MTSRSKYELRRGSGGARGSVGRGEESLRKKLVVVGDGACGKTCLLIAFTGGSFSEAHIPTVFETYVTDLVVEGRRIELALWDTAGQEEYEILRPLSYPNTDVVLLCFSVDNRDSFENAMQKWIPEVRHFCPRTAILLVGTKTDLRRSPGTACTAPGLQARGGGGPTQVQTEEGLVAARSCASVYKYVECSSKTGDGVEDVFQSAGLAILHEVDRGEGKARCCSLL